MQHQYQYVNDPQGKPLYVLVPIADFERLTENEEWEDIPTESDEFDNVTIPHEIVNIMLYKDVSQIAAWRIYRGLTQAKAAEKANMTQAALSQIERKNSCPQARTREQLAKIYDCLPEQLAG